MDDIRLKEQIEISLKPIKDLLKDNKITDIYIDGPKKIYVKKGMEIIDVNNKFISSDDLNIAVDQISRSLNVRLSEENAYLDTKLPGGERINIVIPPISISGPKITIRKFGEERLTKEDLIDLNAIDETGMKILEYLVKSGKRIIISGETGSGKTTLLNILCKFIENSKRVITIEDTEELNLERDHWVRLIVDKKDIFKREREYGKVLTNILRMDPYYIVIGEIRGKEAYVLINAYGSGHKGMATIHSGTTKEALYKLKMLLQRDGLNDQSIKEMINLFVDIVVQVKVVNEKRKIVEISEIEKGRGLNLNILYRLDENFDYKIENKPMFLMGEKYLKNIPKFWENKNGK